MRVRMPNFEFSTSSGRWMPHAPEMAQMLNANSIVIPHLERFLNRVMARARAEIHGDDPQARQIRADISTFIKQESCHYTIHGAFNEMMLANGYDGLPELEKQVAAHYEQLLATKSLRFLVAYCEGFESLTPPMAAAWFDGSMDRVMLDAQPNPANMWRWHIMEEFEHRTVCHDALAALGGGYWLRIYAFFYQLVWYQTMVGKVFRYLLRADRAKMTPQEVSRSKKNARLTVIGFFAPVIGGMRKILRPSYSPRALPEPDGYAAVREMLERDWVPAVERAATA